MRANTSRRRRLAFDTVAELYDRVRPRFAGAPVADLLAHARLQPGDVVVEVGAGTGQLTDALLDAGLRVVALEPGPHLATGLRERVHHRSDALTVQEAFFEDFDTDRVFDAVVAANAFHWVDPAVGYAKAASCLAPGGSLGLLWDFPILADAELQRSLNETAFTDQLADLARDPNSFLDHLDDVLAAGRAEIAGSGYFDTPWWQLYPERRELAVDDYVGLLASLADTVDAETLLRSRLAPLLNREAMLTVIDYVYVSVAPLA